MGIFGRKIHRSPPYRNSASTPRRSLPPCNRSTCVQPRTNDALASKFAGHCGVAPAPLFSRIETALVSAPARFGEVSCAPIPDEIRSPREADDAIARCAARERVFDFGTGCEPRSVAGAERPRAHGPGHFRRGRRHGGRAGHRQEDRRYRRHHRRHRQERPLQLPRRRLESGQYKITIRAVGYDLDGNGVADLPPARPSTSSSRRPAISPPSSPTRSGSRACRARRSRRTLPSTASAATPSTAS